MWVYLGKIKKPKNTLRKVTSKWMTFSALQIFIFELLKFGFHMTFMYAKKILFSKDEIFLEGQKNLKKKIFYLVLTLTWYRLN